MNRSELVARIAAQNPHLYARDIERVVDVILDRMADALADGDRADGDRVDGDRVDGDRADGDRVDGDRVDGDQVDGDRVELRDFGAFSIRDREARTGRNSRSGQRVIVAAKRSVYFKPGKAMRARLNFLKIELERLLRAS